MNKGKFIKYIIITLLNIILIFSAGLPLVSYAENSDIESTSDIEDTIEIENGTYYIKTKLNTNLVLDVAKQSNANGAKIQLWQKSTELTDNQKFNIKSIGDGYYYVEAKHSGKYVDVIGAGKSSGTKVDQYTSNGTDAQIWKIEKTEDGYYTFKSKCNDLFLDVAGGNAKNGNIMQVYKENFTDSQKFKLEEIKELKGTRTIENGDYEISTFQNQSILLDIAGLSRKNEANLQLWEKSNVISKNQRYKVTYNEEGYYYIEAKHSGKVLDVAGGRVSNKSNVQQYEKNGTDAQKWIIKDNEDGTYSVISKKSGLYLDINNETAKNGANIYIYEQTDKTSQKFIFKKLDKEKCENVLSDGTYKISSGLNSKMYLDISGGNISNMANLQIWTNSTVQQQKFHVTYNQEGYYEIINVNSGRSLDVKGGSNSNGANVQQYDSNNTEYQKWILQDAGKGYYYILSRGAERYLDVAGGQSANGTNVQIYDGNQSNSQKFKFEKINIIDEDEYEIQIANNSSKVLDVNQTTSKLQIWECNHASNNQKFKIESLGNDYYKIVNKRSGYALTASNNNVIQQEFTDLESQKWKIETAKNGYYYIKSKSEDMCLDLAGGLSHDGNIIQLYEKNQTKAQYFKFINVYTFEGIDVSSWNGEIDWKKVANSGEANYTIIRAGYRGYVTGNLVEDSYFEKNLTEAYKNGLDVGIYFFTQAINETEAIEEADFTANLLKKYNIKIKYPVAIDSEYSGTWDNHGRADKLSPSERTSVCVAFCERIKSYGYIPMIYASRDWFYNKLEISRITKYEHWVAHYTQNKATVTNYIYPYTMWQYTSLGTINGILGTVDKNIGLKKY